MCFLVFLYDGVVIITHSNLGVKLLTLCWNIQFNRYRKIFNTGAVALSEAKSIDCPMGAGQDLCSVIQYALDRPLVLFTDAAQARLVHEVVQGVLVRRDVVALGLVGDVVEDIHYLAM